VLKKITIKAELKSIILETIRIKYPEQEWFHRYRNESRLSRKVNAAAGVFSDLFAFYASLCLYTIPFDGEMETIPLVDRNLVSRYECFQNAVILSDSKLAIQAIIFPKTLDF
jgi:hypothetical protein